MFKSTHDFSHITLVFIKVYSGFIIENIFLKKIMNYGPFLVREKFLFCMA